MSALLWLLIALNIAGFVAVLSAIQLVLKRARQIWEEQMRARAVTENASCACARARGVGAK